MTSRKCAAICVATLLIFDILISILGEGLDLDPLEKSEKATILSFFRRISFSFRKILENLELASPLHFDFRHSLAEFAFLALIRGAFLLGSFLAIIFSPQTAPKTVKNTSLAVVCLSLAMFSFTLAKLLAFSELENGLKQLGFWLLFVWNLVASTCFTAIWSFVLAGVYTEGTPEDRQGDRAGLLGQEQHADGAGEGEGQELPSLAKKASLTLLVRLLRYCRLEWPWYLSGFVFLFLYSLARVFIPLLTGKVIADIVLTRSYTLLHESVMAMALLSLASAIFSGLRGGCFGYAIARVSRRVRAELFLALVRQEIGFFDENTTGSIMSRLTADCQTMSDTVALNVNVFLRNLVMFIGSLIVMLNLSWRLTLITFIALPIIGLLSQLYGSYYERLSKETQDCLAKASEVAEEVLSSMRTVRSFANELGESRRYNQHLDKTLKISLKQEIAYVGFTWCNELFDMAILVAVLWYGGHLVLSGQMLATDLISFLLYQLQLGEAAASMGYVFTGLMQAVGASRKVFDYIDREPKVKHVGHLAPNLMEGKVEFRNVCFSYPTRPEVQVLQKMSFTVFPGETVALVGPSGGGKSSCISLLEHFYDAGEGQVLIDGVPVQQYDHDFLHRKIALVGQEPVLFARSVRENISYGLHDDEWTEEFIEQCSKMANAANFVDRLPLAYDANVGEKGLQLSGGQKQRIAIARALLRRPKVLLLDEATSALDSESEHLVGFSSSFLGFCQKFLEIFEKSVSTQQSSKVLEDGLVKWNWSEEAVKDGQNKSHKSPELE